MKILAKVLTFILVPLALFAALPPAAEDLREMRAIVDSPVLNQILSPDEGVFFIGKDPTELKRSVYIIESNSHTIGVVVSRGHVNNLLGPGNIELKFYAVQNNEPIRGTTFQDTFSSAEPIAAEENGHPSKDPDIVRIRGILDSPDLYTELLGGRVEFITRVSIFGIERMRNELAAEQGLDSSEMALQDALNSASLEKSEVYLIGIKYQDRVALAEMFAFVIYPEDFEIVTPHILFFHVPDEEPAGFDQ